MSGPEDARIREIVRMVMAEEKRDIAESDFHVPHKEQYDVHQRLMYIFKCIDGVAAVVGRTLVWLVLIGIIAIIAYGAGFKKP